MPKPQKPSIVYDEYTKSYKIIQNYNSPPSQSSQIQLSVPDQKHLNSNAYGVANEKSRNVDSTLSSKSSALPNIRNGAGAGGRSRNLDYSDNLSLLSYSNNKYNRYLSESPTKEDSADHKFKKHILLKNSGVLIPYHSPGHIIGLS